MNRWLSLIGFLAIVIGGGLAIGFLTAPGDWYEGLAKASLNPPAWLFAPVWTVLYVLIAVTGWRVWQRDRSGWPMRLWWGAAPPELPTDAGVLRRAPTRPGARQ
jgi:tryptophan-rich sensory protein